ncbi:MAG: hypothetical protein C0608_11920 [Deltaproteobacteria bacterium]|nr:MAG: hypothetical protein C0608_11920 [Deltaproteobacteria bacterium]
MKHKNMRHKGFIFFGFDVLSALSCPSFSYKVLTKEGRILLASNYLIVTQSEILQGLVKIMNNEKKLRRKGGLLWLLPLALVILITYLIMLGATRQPEAPPLKVKRLANVEAMTVKLRPYDDSLTLPARIEAIRSGEVSPRFGGIIDKWFVSEGSYVKKGAPVAALDSASVRASLDELMARQASAEASVAAAKGGVDAAEASLEKARRDASAIELDISSAKSARDLAEAELKRIENLYDEGVMDQSSLDRARDAAKRAALAVKSAEDGRERATIGARAAEAVVEQAKANLSLAEARVKEIGASIETVKINIDNHTLYAPVAGRLEEHLFETGEFVPAGKVVARIYDLSKVHAIVDVPDRYIAFLGKDAGGTDLAEAKALGAKPLSNVSLVIPGLPKLTGGEGEGIKLNAKIVRIALSADKGSHTFPVELEAENPSNSLKDGIVGRAEISFLHYPDAVVIPLSSVQVTDKGARVFVLEERYGENIAISRPIEPISVMEDELHVGEGLGEGDLIVVSGWKGVVSGEEVNVVVKDGKLLGSSL